MDAHMIEPSCLTESLRAGVRFRRASLGLENGFAGVAECFVKNVPGVIRRETHHPGHCSARAATRSRPGDRGGALAHVLNAKHAAMVRIRMQGKNLGANVHDASSARSRMVFPQI
jgi:hypothetical protein